MKRIVVLISGSGSNLQSLIDVAQHNKMAGSISAVISNRPDAFGLERARRAGIKTYALDHSAYASREAFDKKLVTLIDQQNADLVVLAGYLRILSADFVTHYSGKLLNIHPSLLPKYPGLNTHRRALAAGETEHGASIHFVTQDLDCGPLIIQARIPIAKNDTEQSLAHKVLTQEHRIYPLVVKWFCEQRLKLKQHTAVLDDLLLTAPMQFDINTGEIYLNACRITA